MAETWAPPWSGTGSWREDGTFNSRDEPGGFNSRNWVYVWWDDAPVPDGDGLVSAVLRFTTDDRYARWRLVDLDDAPVGDSGTPRPTSTIDSGYIYKEDTYEVDITDAL